MHQGNSQRLLTDDLMIIQKRIWGKSLAFFTEHSGFTVRKLCPLPIKSFHRITDIPFIRLAAAFAPVPGRADHLLIRDSDDRRDCHFCAFLPLHFSRERAGE